LNLKSASEGKIMFNKHFMSVKDLKKRIDHKGKLFLMTSNYKFFLEN